MMRSWLTDTEILLFHADFVERLRFREYFLRENVLISGSTSELAIESVSSRQQVLKPPIVSLPNLEQRSPVNL
jgi:hypothetical protein